MGPCTANVRRPTVDSRCRGTTIGLRGVVLRCDQSYLVLPGTVFHLCAMSSIVFTICALLLVTQASVVVPRLLILPTAATLQWMQPTGAV